MKNTAPTITRATLVENIQTCRDKITGNDVAYSLATIADFALAESNTLRANLTAAAAGLGWGMAPRTRFNQMANNVPADTLTRIALSAILEAMPEVAEARVTIAPLVAELEQAEAALAAHDAERAGIRQALTEKLAAAEERKENDPELLKLRAELSAMD